MQIHSSRTGAYSTNLVLKSKGQFERLTSFCTHHTYYLTHVEKVRSDSVKAKPDDLCKEKMKRTYSLTFRTPKLLPQISIKIPHDRDFKHTSQDDIGSSSSRNNIMERKNSARLHGDRGISVLGLSIPRETIFITKPLLPEISSVGTERGTLLPGFANRLTPDYHPS